MSRASIILIFISVLINSTASLLLKKGASALTSGSLRDQAVQIGWWKAINPALNFYTVTGMVLLVVSFAMFLVILSKVPVSIAQPMLAMSYILITLGAFFFYGEPLSTQKLIGIAVIIVGIVILSNAGS